MAINELQVKSPLAMYTPDYDHIANGGGLETAKLSGYEYVVTDSAGNAAVAKVQVDASGVPKAGVVVGLRVVFAAQTTAQALDELVQLAQQEPLRSGSYEVRLFYAPEERDAPVFWLKSDSPGGDLIDLISRLGSARLQPNTLYPAEDYLKAIRPTLQLQAERRKNSQATIQARAQTAPPKTPEVIKWASEKQMNDYFVEKFISVNGNGMGRMDSHRMFYDDSMRLVLGDATAVDAAPQVVAGTYKFDRVGRLDPDLIGIAKHNPPVVFNGLGGALVQGTRGISQGYPIETRVLTDFETKSLAVLRTGPDTTSMPTGDGGRIIIGAVRAQESCLQCHAGAKVGDLLGAFSYHMRLVAPPSVTTNAKNP